MKVYIVSEGGSGIGFGHITRCLSLYQAFEEKRIAPHLIINGDASTADLLKAARYKRLNWVRQKREFARLIAGADIVIIDSYLAGVGLYQMVAGLAKLAVYIDDNKRLNYPAGIVVNGGVHAEGIPYPKISGLTYLLGPRYAPIRKEFWTAPKKRIGRRPKDIMVTFGGCDFQNMTAKVLGLLVKTQPNMLKKVIIGRGVKNIESVKKEGDNKTTFIYYPDGASMKQLMLESDIVVSAGGQTMYELARVGATAAIIAVADNQLAETLRLKRAGFIEYAGWWKDKNILEGLEACLGRLMDYGARQKMAAIGRALVDGKGPIRTANFLIRYAQRYDTLN